MGAKGADAHTWYIARRMVIELGTHHALLLPPAQLHPTLPHHGVEPVRQRLERPCQLRGIRGRPRLLPARPGLSVRNVLQQRSVEERALL